MEFDIENVSDTRDNIKFPNPIRKFDVISEYLMFSMPNSILIWNHLSKIIIILLPLINVLFTAFTDQR